MAVTKTEDGRAFPAGDFAYVPDKTKPSTWKLRLTSEPGGDPDPAIVGAAAAALGPGYRGRKVAIPTEDLAAVKAKVRAAWKKANPDKDEEEMPEGLMEAAFDEAATYKSIIQGLVRSAHAVAGHKNVPAPLRKQLKDLRAMLKQSYPDMVDGEDGAPAAVGATEASGDTSGFIGQPPAMFAEIALRVGQSMDEYQQMLRQAVADKVGQQDDFWLSDVYEDRLVYCAGRPSKYYEMPYAIGENNTVTLGAATEVERAVTYRPKVMAEAGGEETEFRELGVLVEVADG